MTAKSRTTLKGAFETGDVPTGSDYEDLIDSAVNLVDTTAQSMAGALGVTTLTATEVSAGTVNFTTKVSGSAANFIGVVSASSLTVLADISAQTLSASALSVPVSASIGAFNCTTLRINTTVTAAATVGGGDATPASVAAYVSINVNGTGYLLALFPGSN